MHTGFNINLPTSWQQLTEEQLRYAYRRIAEERPAESVLIHCALKWAGIKLIYIVEGVYQVRKGKQCANLEPWQVYEIAKTVAFLKEMPEQPVRLERIGRHRAIRADLQELTFEAYLTIDNLYQGYLQTKRTDLMEQIAQSLYKAKRIRLKPWEVTSVFYWWTAAKQMLARRYKHLYKSTGGGEGTLPDYDSLKRAMDTQIRALTGGDITKEEQVLDMPMHRALTELDEKAREYEEIKSKTNG